MKILIFMTQFYHLGGAERLAVELAEALNKGGIHTDILSLYADNLPNASEAREELLRLGIPKVRFLGMKTAPSTSSVLPAILRLQRLLIEEEYDIVETSMTPPAIIASWATLGTPTRHVAGLHQVFRKDRENSWTHRLWRFSAMCNRHLRYYAISDYVAESWIKYSMTPLHHTRRVYNCITDDCFESVSDRPTLCNELDLPEEVRLVAYVGRLAAYKGIGTLLEALGPVLYQHNLAVLYVGIPDLSVTGTRELLQTMEQRIIAENWSERIRFLGLRKDIPRVMASVDVLVHPTRMEGFGLTLVEALATGLPIVSSNAEAIPEVLAGTDSILVPPNELHAFRDAVLETLKRSPEEKARANEKGRMRAQEFRAERRLASMIRLYQEVLEGVF